jgi:hypothetical protein
VRTLIAALAREGEAQLGAHRRLAGIARRYIRRLALEPQLGHPPRTGTWRAVTCGRCTSTRSATRTTCSAAADHAEPKVRISPAVRGGEWCTGQRRPATASCAARRARRRQRPPGARHRAGADLVAFRRAAARTRGTKHLRRSGDRPVRVHPTAGARVPAPAQPPFPCWPNHTPRGPCAQGAFPGHEQGPCGASSLIRAPETTGTIRLLAVGGARGSFPGAELER